MATIDNHILLISGGYGQTTPVVHNSAEVFTLDTRTFAATGSMRVPRADHAAATLKNFRVLLTGGLTPIGATNVTTDISSTEIFNASTGTFIDGPNMSVARFNHSAITLNDGRVLVLGGNGRNTAEIYSPVTNTFVPAGNMSVVHGNGHTAVKLLNGKVLVIGGDQATIQPTAVAELFDPATNAFSPAGNMTSARMLHFAVLFPDGRVVIGGGRGADGSDLDTVEIYDPVANTFTASEKMPGSTSDQPAGYVRRGG